MKTKLLIGLLLAAALAGGWWAGGMQLQPSHDPVQPMARRAPVSDGQPSVAPPAGLAGKLRHLRSAEMVASSQEPPKTRATRGVPGRNDWQHHKNDFEFGAQLAQRGDASEAIHFYVDALRLGPLSDQQRFNAHCQLCALRIAVGAVSAGHDDCLTASRLRGDHPLPHLLLGDSLMTQGQWGAALREYDRGLGKKDAEGVHFDLRLHRGRLNYDIGRFEAAAADFEAAIALAESSRRRAAAYFGRGLALEALGQTERAIADLDSTIRGNPGLAAAYGSRGALYARQGRGELALWDFQEALRRDTGTVLPLIHAAALRQLRGEHDLALADLSRALAVAKTPELAALAQHRRALSLLYRDRAEEALRALEAALTIAPDDGALLVWQFHAAARLGRNGRLAGVAERLPAPWPRLLAQVALDAMPVDLALSGVNDLPAAERAIAATQILFHGALAAARAGRVAQARDLLARATETAPPDLPERWAAAEELRGK